MQKLIISNPSFCLSNTEITYRKTYHVCNTLVSEHLLHDLQKEGVDSNVFAITMNI
jgi:hypothetical protein